MHKQNMELKEGQNGKPNIELNNTGRSGEGCREAGQ
jgi:hypothetical protein